jgi:hypothetical protein
MTASYSDGWSWCNRCQGLIDGPQGVCPAGGVHNSAGSGDYFMLFVDGDMAGPSQQPGWRLCRKCHGLFYGPRVGNSSCPAGAHHDAGGSPSMALQVDDGSPTSNQKGWRYCHRCQGLFYGLNPASPCPSGGVHDGTNSAAYDLPFFGVPWIGTYVFQGALRAQGSNYTVGGEVDVFTKFKNGSNFHAERATAITNQSAPGGWMTAGTASLSGGQPFYNGFLQAFDRASRKWSPRLPITISQRID